MYTAAELKLRGLEPSATYVLKNYDTEGEKRVSGKHLMETGMSVKIPERPGAVTIKTEHHLGTEAEQATQVVRRGGGTQGRHGIADIELGQGHHIHIAFIFSRSFFLAVFRLITQCPQTDLAQ